MRKLIDTRRGALCAPVTNVKIGRTQFVPTDKKLNYRLY